MTINEYYGYKDDNFTHNSKALLHVIGNFNEYCILCDLIGKYLYLSNGEKKLKEKTYHFFLSKEETAKKDFLLDLRTYNRALKRLQEKGYITVFSDRNPKDMKKKISFFYLHRSKIQNAFKEGYRLLYNKDPPIYEQQNRKKTNNDKDVKTYDTKLTIDQQKYIKIQDKKLKAKHIAPTTYEDRVNFILNKNNKGI